MYDKAHNYRYVYIEKGGSVTINRPGKGKRGYAPKIYYAGGLITNTRAGRAVSAAKSLGFRQYPGTYSVLFVEEPTGEGQP